MSRVVLVGGGIVGASCAYHLREGPHDVTLVERDRIGRATTAASMGVFSWQQQSPSPFEHRLRRRAWSAYEPLVGDPLPFVRTGARYVPADRSGLADLRDVADALRGFGLEASVREPDHLGPPVDPGAVPGALYTPEDGHLDPTEVAETYAERAGAAGVELLTGTSVTDVHTDGAAVTGVATTAGELAADVVVNAAGPWAPALDRLAGVTHPLRRTRGPILRYETGEDPAFPFTLFAGGQYLRRCPGGVYVGRYDTTYRPDREIDPAPARPADEFRNAVRRELPAILATDVTFPAVEEWVGYRTVTPDGRPLVGPTGVEGYHLACGMNGLGVTLAPVVGRLVRTAIEGGDDAALDRLRPARFD